MYCRRGWTLKQAMVVIVTTMLMMLCLATAAPTSLSAVGYQVTAFDDCYILLGE